ncbi:MAG: PIN domain-containing protein, partial [Thermoplasmata archaeon]|nr:PIN domain-containing protein [Thermoplasmata archaeon]
AGLFKDGTVRDTLLSTHESLFAAPSYLRDEVSRHLVEVAARARIPVPTVEVIFEDLLGAIDLMPSGVYSDFLQPATKLARTAGAPEDVDDLALALSLDAPIWTLDKDFRRIPGIRVLSTKDVNAKGRRITSQGNFGCRRVTCNYPFTRHK